MIAAPGATCGAPKRGWNGWSKPSRPQQGRASAAMPRERAKSSRKRDVSWRDVSWRCDEHACAKSEKRILRKARSGAPRRSEFVSRASSMSSTCSGRQLAATASSRRWRPGAPAPARGSTVATRVPAVPGRGTDRRSRALDQSVTCRELAASGFPECAGSGPWRVDAQTWQNRTRINRQRALLTAPVPHWQAKAPRPGGNGFLDAGRAPPWPTVENPKRHATATLCRIVGLA